ncbi:Methyltransferase domain family protein [gamma proteobacterium NOR5-3]|nr:Methyltransferase domain family protein [gamma proteobacterium NOR5-3]
MAQKTTGLHGILSSPAIYDFFQNVLGARKFRQTYAQEYVTATTGERILDIGCGTAIIREFLPDKIDYVGCDVSKDYISAAKKRFGGRGNFLCQMVDEITIEELGQFDVVMANGLIHHLDDIEVSSLCSLVIAALKPGGRFVTHDPCFSGEQGLLANFLISRDRGQNVRDKQGYLSLVEPHFEQASIDVRHGLARIPYTHAILVARKRGAANEMEKDG